MADMIKVLLHSDSRQQAVRVVSVQIVILLDSGDCRRELLVVLEENNKDSFSRKFSSNSNFLNSTFQN